MRVLLLIAIIIIAVILVRITEMLLRFFFGNRQKLKIVIRYFPIIELLATLLIFFWAIDYLFSEKSYYQVLILSLVISSIILISWFVARDLIAGLVFRMQNNLPRGASVQFGKTKGKLLQMRSTHIIIETNEGQIVKMPYSRVANEIISEYPVEGVREDSKLKLNISKKMSWSETEGLLRKTLLNTPWRLMNADPIINLLSDEGQHYIIQVFVKTRNKEHANRIHALLLSKYGEE